MKDSTHSLKRPATIFRRSDWLRLRALFRLCCHTMKDIVRQSKPNGGMGFRKMSSLDRSLTLRTFGAASLCGKLLAPDATRMKYVSTWNTRILRFGCGLNMHWESIGL